ncbi:MAG: UvrD-helicase domain-containing protein [candidate division KSB1 bacterium]|nr:UvrD-helicase domain-containing protein [candidate division KSB1 bacterium]
MQQNFIKRVIRASAGTGKTYRLSLEYLSLLCQYRHLGCQYKEILVITFTRKATAEIRDRIFTHLNELVNPKGESEELRRNLESVLGRSLSRDDLHFLRRSYHDMLSNKHQVKIMTIDSFTNTVFKSIIAPFLHIYDHEIDNVMDDAVKDNLFHMLLNDSELWEVFRSFLERGERKTIQAYEQFLNTTIKQRWLYHMIDESGARDFEHTPPKADALYQAVRQQLKTLLIEFQQHVLKFHADARINALLKKNAKDFFNIEPDTPLEHLSDECLQAVEDRDHLEQKGHLLFDPFWNGGKVFRANKYAEAKDHFLSAHQEFVASLAEYLLWMLAVPEEREIRELIRKILREYDELTLRNRVFSHSDISFYTYRFLYDPELSMVTDDTVTNDFYEHLTAKYRFMLIDEFQDTSLIQFRILMPIIREVISGAGIKEYGGVIVVGDEKQAIYGWRGGERDLLLSMPRLFSGQRSTAAEDFISQR